jgi:ribonuclease HII
MRAGRGPLCGPVVIAGVIFNDDFDEEKKKKIRDSKKMTEKAREEM